MSYVSWICKDFPARFGATSLLMVQPSVEFVIIEGMNTRIVCHKMFFPDTSSSTRQVFEYPEMTYPGLLTGFVFNFMPQ